MNENSPQPTPAINDWLTRATTELRAAGIPSARLDAELILSHTLRVSRTVLHAHPETPLTERQEDIANARLALRRDRVPVAYIIGHKEFYGHRFIVNSATLVPRPESESLIELLEKIIPRNQSLLGGEQQRLVDVGTGSGILGITAKLLHPDELDVTLIDNSRHALAVAKKNAAQLKADCHVLQSDLLASYPFTADVIMANLPYVDPEWERSPETDHEPAEALFAAQGGLSLINELLIQSRTHLRPGGHMILEADPEQHERIIAEARHSHLVLVETDGYGLLLEKVA